MPELGLGHIYVVSFSKSHNRANTNRHMKNPCKHIRKFVVPIRI